MFYLSLCTKKDMQTAEVLSQTLNRIDGKGYKAYKDIQGAYDFEKNGYTLHLDYIQGDPFAAPSKARVILSQDIAGFPYHTFQNKSREVALRDFITRCFHQAISKYTKGHRGSGKSGIVSVDRPGQEILERTSTFVDQERVEVRLTIGLPAYGRKIAGRQAKHLFFEELPGLVEYAMVFDNLDQHALNRHIETNEDADYLRKQLSENQWIAFIADQSILPRNSGIDPRPMDTEQVIPFESPDSMRRDIVLPNRGNVSGMFLSSGITLIVGGGFHGKSTLLNAIELGIYNHIPGDGRELVITDPTAVKIRSEDGRRIEKVDITPFISNLPLGKSTRAFSTEDASGSTSQAANIIEAVQIGSQVLLIDEDTSATNFMIRDLRMQQLIHKNEEPITPFIDKVRQLHQDMQVSTILVMGGSGDYFAIADQVIGMNNYKPANLTQQAKQIHEQMVNRRTTEGGDIFGRINQRYPLPQSIRPHKGKKIKKIKTNHRHSLQLGTYVIDLRAQEQLTDQSQTHAIGEALVYAKQYMDGHHNMKMIVEQVFRNIASKGLTVIGNAKNGNYAMFRPQEFAAALNRLRSLSIQQKTESAVNGSMK